MAVKNFPCKDCKNRTINCHSTCEAYLKAKGAYNKEMVTERRKRDIENYLNQRIIERETGCTNYGFQKDYLDY